MLLGYEHVPSVICDPAIWRLLSNIANVAAGEADGTLVKDPHGGPLAVGKGGREPHMPAGLPTML